MKTKAVRGIVRELDLGKGPFLTLDMPRKPDEARMSFNLEAILRHYFFGKAIIIIEDEGEEIEEASVDLKKLGIISGDKLAEDLGVE